MFLQREIDMRVSSEMVRRKDMENIFIQMEINMKDNGLKIRSMEKVLIHIC